MKSEEYKAMLERVRGFREITDQIEEHEKVLHSLQFNSESGREECGFVFNNKGAMGNRILIRNSVLVPIVKKILNESIQVMKKELDEL